MELYAETVYKLARVMDGIEHVTDEDTQKSMRLTVTLDEDVNLGTIFHDGEGWVWSPPSED